MTKKLTLKELLEKDWYFHNGWMLEEYVKSYLQLYNEPRWDDGTLKELFWSSMDDTLCPFVEFVDYILWVCGAPLTVGERSHYL